MRREHDGLWLRASNSSRDGKEFGQLGDFLAVFQPVSEDAKSQSPDLGNGIFPCSAVSHDTCEVRDLCKPTAILFAFNFYLHGRSLRGELYPLRRALTNSPIPSWPIRRSREPPGETALTQEFSTPAGDATSLGGDPASLGGRQIDGEINARLKKDAVNVAQIAFPHQIQFC